MNHPVYHQDRWSQGGKLDAKYKARIKMINFTLMNIQAYNNRGLPAH